MSKLEQSQVNTDIFLFHYEVLVCYEYAPEGQPINKGYYLQIMNRLRDTIRRKQPQLRASSGQLLYHDNAPARALNLMQQYLTKYGIVQIYQPPYSPDIALCDFRLFPKLKMPLKGQRFEDIEMTETNTMNVLRAIPKSEYQD